MKKRIFSIFTAMALLFSTLPVNALAVGNADAGGLCEHHPAHTAECGYAEGAEGTPCNHEHTEDCYTLVEKCIHEHTDECYPEESVSGNTATPGNAEEQEPTECAHECSEESGCIVKELDCQHEHKVNDGEAGREGGLGHDDECGYAPATEGTPCTFVCDICGAESTEQEENTKAKDAKCICDSLCTGEKVNVDCPVCGVEDADLTLCKGAETETATHSNAAQLSAGDVQKLIDELPTADGLAAMSSEEQQAVYEKLQATYDAYETLSDEQKAEVIGTEIFKELFAVFNSLISPLANEETYNINDRPVTIDDSCGDNCPSHKITGNGQTTKNPIKVTGGTHDITIENVNIDVYWDKNICAFSIENDAKVNLTLKGSNTLKSSMNYAGLHVPDGAALTITEASNGSSLEAIGHSNSAGIGGSYYANNNSGTITIKGGTVKATGDYRAAGIGGGMDGNGGTITISGGDVTATGAGWGAGIGGGGRGSSGTIIISGGTVTAIGGSGGAGIGGGYRGDGCDITISSGNVMVQGGENAKDIGDGRGGDPSEKIEISNNAIVKRPDNQPVRIGESHGVDNSKWKHDNDSKEHWHPCKIAGCDNKNHQSERNTYALIPGDDNCTTAESCSLCGETIVAEQTDHSFNNYIRQDDASYFKNETEKAMCDNPSCAQTDTHEISNSKKTDSTAPEGTIKIGQTEWKALLNKLTFGLFFKDKQNVTITATDDSSKQEGYNPDQHAVKVGYYLDNGDTPLNEIDLAGKDFTEYIGTFPINPDKKLVVYVKLTDWAGNVTYISSDGIILDSTPPEISGIENNKTYCEAVEITVTDDYLDTVTVDGTPKSPAADGKLTINPKTGAQVIAATDEAGNKTTYTITVNDGHTYTAINDCTKEEKCSVCDEVIKAAKDHVPQDDDGDCTTAIKCKKCDVITTAAKTDHEPEDDDGDCTTPIKCKNCNVITTVAEGAHDFTKTDASEKYLKSAATCKAQAVYYKSCSACATSSQGIDETAVFAGDVDPDAHINTELRGKEEATPDKAGYTGDLYCKDCGKLLEQGSIVPATEYIITFDGNGGTDPAPQTTTGKKLTSLPTSDQSGYSFKGWFTKPTGGSKITTSTIFTESMTVYAQWTDAPSPAEKHSVTVQTNGNGTASASHSFAEVGVTITLTATPSSGYHFKEWQVVSGNVTISGNSFNMPANDVTIQAIFEKNSSSGGNTGGSSGGGNSGSSSSGGNSGGGSTIIDRPTEKHPDIPTTSETKPVKPDTGGKVAIGGDSIQDAINKATTDANKNGNKDKGIAVTVPVNNASDAKTLTVTIPAGTLDKLVAAKVRRFDITTNGLPSFSFTLDTLEMLDQQSLGGDLILRLAKTTVTSKQAKAAVSTRPVYDITLVFVKDGKETPFTDWQGRTVSVKLPYTPAKDEQTGNLYAVYVDAKGKVEWLAKSSYNANQKAVIFEASHFSIYGVGYKDPAPVFTDITGHWAADNIIFAASRGLLAGTGNNQFSPNTGMTRGMFVTALGRLAGIDPESYKTGKFTDVKADAYYAPYVNWAAEKGIVSGTSATTFSPDTNITREQMAVIMAGYAKKMGYDLPVVHEAVTFADNAQISSWAAKEVKAMQQAGIMAGKGGNRFDPKGTATRAEVATVLRRFVEIVIDPQAAQGWMQDHSGSWQYMKDGKAVTGWLYDDKKWYWLDNNGWTFANGWKQIGGKWYYFYSDGSMAVDTTIDGYTIGPDGARK